MSLENIKVGDRVVWGTWNYRANTPHHIAVHLVTKVTPKKFSTNNRSDLYSKTTGKAFGDSDYMYHRIATPEECGKYDAEQLNKQRAEAIRRANEEAIRLKGVELFRLFPEKLSVYCEIENDAWNVTLRGLTEAEVKSLAEKVK